MFIQQPILKHYVETLSAFSTEHLNQTKQRSGDVISDAEGFADALDIGGAF